MADPKKYFAEHTRVFDDAGKQMCDCRDEGTAVRIAQALSHLSAYEAEHEPLTKEEWENLGKTLDESNRQYQTEHPNFDQSVNSLAKLFKM